MNWAQCRRNPLKNDVLLHVSLQWNLWFKFFFFFPFGKLILHQHTQGWIQMHQHICSAKNLQGKFICQQEVFGTSLRLFTTLPQQRLQVLFIVPHWISSNFLKDNHSLDRGVYANITQKCTNQHSTVLKLSSVPTWNKQVTQKPDTQKYQWTGSSSLAGPAAFLEEALRFYCYFCI